MLHHRYLGLSLGQPSTQATVAAPSSKTSSSSNSSSSSVTAGSGSELAAKIRAFYEDRASPELRREHNPVDPDRLAEKYAGRSDALFARLELKYPASSDNETIRETVPPADCSPSTVVYTALKTVSFHGHGRTLSTKADVSDIVAAIVASPEIVEIVMGGNTIGLDAMKAIVSALVKSERACQTLTRLDFDDCFTRRKEEELHPSLRALGEVISAACLNEISMCDNALNPEGAKIMAPILAKNCSSLTSLRLDNTGIGPLGGQFLGMALRDGAKRGMQLQIFSLGRSRLEDKGGAAIAAALADMGTLNEINMPQNGIRAAGITALSDAIKANPELRHLNLNDNSFGKLGCAAIANALRCCPKLAHVDFGDCLLRSTGFEPIAASLATNHPDLQFIDMTYNEIQEENVESLVLLLDGKVMLKRVEINGNVISEESIEKIKNVLSRNCGNTAAEVLGDTDEMEDPDDDNDDDDDDSNNESNSESDDDNSDDESDGDGTSNSAEVAKLLETLSVNDM